MSNSESTLPKSESNSETETDDSARETATIVIESRQAILDAAVERGIDPDGLEVIESRTSADHDLVVRVEHAGTLFGGEERDREER